ncbi:MAG: permease-like cell division protein FtsX [Gemmatimonadota bacterium]|nr:permease-like cell division protein FtsX [Gemmatimonadota bacterium]
MRPVREALASFRRTPLLGGLSIAAISLSLLILGLFSLSAYNISTAIGDVERRVEIVGYLLDDVPDETIAIAGREMEVFPEVEEVRYVSKTEALVNARRDLVEFSDVYQDLEVNPLPASLHLRLAEGHRGPEAVEAVAARLAGYEFIEDVRFGEGWVEQLFAIRRMAGGAAGLLGGAFALVAVLLIGTSVRMAILARSEEIEIMQTVGATEGYIQRPFLVEGFVTGLLGGLFALALTRVAYSVFTERFAGFETMAWLPDLWVGGGILAAAGLGVLAASFAVRRELGRAYAF